MKNKKQLYQLLTASDIKILAECKGKTANSWINAHGIYRKTNGGDGPMLVTTKSIIGVINLFRVKNGNDPITILDVPVILERFENEKKNT